MRRAAQGCSNFEPRRLDDCKAFPFIGLATPCRTRYAYAPMTQATAPKYRIAVGENHPDLAESLCMLIDFQEDMQSVGHGSSTAAILAIEAASAPDAYVLDLSLDDGSSIPLMKLLRAARSDAVLIAYTGHSNPALTDQCQKAGCDLVLTKAGPVDELLNAIRGALHRRRDSASPS
jgi:DNA-binding NarL/FixJ family response regulator